MAVAFKQSAEYIMGDTAQKQWAELCVTRGGLVLPVYDYTEISAEEKAPTVLTSGGAIIAPDVLYVTGGGEAKWHDVKAKTAATWRRCPPGPRWEHGIDWSAAMEYLRVQNESGIPVYIIVRDAEIDRWLAISLDHALRAGERRRDWPGGKKEPHRRGRRGMGGLLWDRDEMVAIDAT